MNGKFSVLQDDFNDCGICCLLSVIKYYHGNASKEYLKEETRTTKNGVNALNLLNCARKLGFEAYGIKGKIGSINTKLLPVIAHVLIDKKYPHFIVIYKIDLIKRRILVMDPTKGFAYYSIDSFINISTSYYLILKPKHIIPKLENDSNYVFRIYKIISNYKNVFLLITIMSLTYTIINIVGSYHFKLLNELVNNNMSVLLFFLISLIFIKHLINYFRIQLLIIFNCILDKTLVKDAFYHIINLPYLYYRNHTNGDLLTRINDLGNIKDLLSNFFISLFVDLTLAIIIIIFMFNISIKLSILVLISMLLYSLISIFNSVNIKSTIRDTYQYSSIVNNSLVESLSSFETIKNLSIQNYILNSFISKYTKYYNANRVLFKKVERENLLKNIILEIGNLLIIYFGIKMIGNSQLSVASLITFISLSQYLINPIKKIMDLHLTYQNSKESIRRIKELYNIKPEEIKTSHRLIKYLSGDIVVDNLSYSYNGIDYIINNLSLEINDGDKVLIYGNSGNGKSTLMKILIKYIDNNYNGNITIGGYDLADIDLKSLRENICYVSQNEYLYTNTIYENITLGKRIKYSYFLDIVNNLSINEIVKSSNLNYNLTLENNGENISGGERKRIIIARSILQKANIYIYDESFSEMDIDLERKILLYLFKLYPKKTFIIISHRYSNEDLFNKKIKIGGENY